VRVQTLEEPSSAVRVQTSQMPSSSAVS
jgi:hypothetical protein